MAKITWLGHASFRIEMAGRTLLIDPFIEGNPASPLKSVAEAGSPDLVLVTHAHGDHGMNEAITICKEHGAQLVSFFDLIQQATERGLPAELGVGGNIGGTVPLNGISVTLTQAFHTIAIVGMVIRGGDFTLYYSSDTGLFGDMALIGRHGLDLAILPIGDYFTMGIEDAAYAVELLKPKAVIPMHYNTFPPIEADPQQFAALVEEKTGGRVRTIVLDPGESVEL